MAVAKRSIGKKPSLDQILTVSKEFTDETMKLDIHDVLREAKRVRSIGRTAARMTGESLQLEGDYISKQIVFAAYETIYDVTYPSFLANGPDVTQELFTTDTTHTTLLHLSREIKSFPLSKVTRAYREHGKYLVLTDNGLGLDPDAPIPKRYYTAEDKGCPYAKNENGRYFNPFTDHAVATYAEAHRQNMPDGWLEAVRHLVNR